MLLINSIVVYNMNYEITHKSPKGGFYMKITFIGATHEVTGSCYYLEAADHKFLVDCGMEQGPDYYEMQRYQLLWEKLSLFFLPMRIWIIPEIFLLFMQKDFEGQYTQRTPPVIV